MSILLSIAGYLFLVYFLVSTFKHTSSSLRIYFVPVLLLHILGGIGVGLIYQYYYHTGDTVQYFENAQVIKKWLSGNPDQFLKFIVSSPDRFEVPFHEEPRALLMQKIVTIVSYLGFNNYYLTSLYFSTISFAALWGLADRLLLYYKRLIPVSVSFLLLPMVAFWGSGILKESILVMTLAVYVSMMIAMAKSGNFDIKRIAMALICLWLMYLLKYYYAAVIILLTIPFAVTVLVDRQLIRLRKGYALMVLLLTMLVILIPVSNLHPNLRYDNVMDVIADNNQEFMEKSDPNNVIRFHNLKPTIGSFLANLPVALFSGLFRPLIFEEGNVFKHVVGAGNLILVCLIFFIFPIRKVKDETDFLLLITCCLYIIIMATFLAFSTPNFGTLSRYKVGYLPFFTFLLLYNNRLLYWVQNKLKLEFNG